MTIATLAKLAAQGVVRRDERVVALVTGHGLKTVEALAGVVRPTVTIAPTLDAFDAAVGSLSGLDGASGAPGAADPVPSTVTPAATTQEEPTR